MPVSIYLEYGKYKVTKVTVQRSINILKTINFQG